MGDAHHCSGPPVFEMTYTVSSGTLNLVYHTVLTDRQTDRHTSKPMKSHNPLGRGTVTVYRWPWRLSIRDASV